MPAMYPDAYDRCIDYLMSLRIDKVRAREIHAAWMDPLMNPGGLLFCHVTPDGQYNTWEYDDQSPCGCLTQVADGRRAHTVELTKAIQADRLIPRGIYEFNCLPLNHLLPVLEHFADWQRRIDLELNRAEPQWIWT